MPAKRRPAKPTPKAPSWQIILEEIRSQNRATIEATLAAVASLRAEQSQHAKDAAIRDANLELAVKGLQLEVRRLAATVETLADLPGRVAALEKRSA
jgi:hypothetical protein